MMVIRGFEFNIGRRPKAKSYHINIEYTKIFEVSIRKNKYYMYIEIGP